MKSIIKINCKKLIVLIILLAFMPLNLASCSAGLSRDSRLSPGAGKTGEEFKKELEEESVDEGEFTGVPDFTLLGKISMPGQAIDVKVAGNYAFLTNDVGNFYIIKIRDKNDPAIVGKLNDLDSSNIVIVRDNYAYISYTKWVYENNESYTECGFYIVDVSDKKNPQLIGNYNTGENNVKSAYGLFIEGNYAYIETDVSGKKTNDSSLEIVDISDKKNPVIVNKFKLNGIPSNIWVKDNLAFVNINYYDYEKEEFTDKSELIIIDIKDKNNPEIKGSCKINSGSRGLYTQGNYAYITSWDRDIENEKYSNSMFQILDVENPSNIKISGNCKIPDAAWEIDSAGDILFISSLSGGLYAVDVTDKNKPVITDILNTGGISYDITIQGNYGYIADGFEGMLIAELSGESFKADGKAAKLSIDYVQDKNMPPVTIIDIYGGTIEEENFQVRNPVYLSSRYTYDPDGDELEYKWVIDGEDFSDEESCFYYFNKPGNHTVKLSVSDGSSISEDTEMLSVVETNFPIEPVCNHNFKLEIVYNLINKSNIILKDIECYIMVPQTYYPFQIVNSYETSIQKTDEILDNYGNSHIHFKFSNDLKANSNLTATLLIDIASSEFKYIKESSLDYLAYDVEDEDFKKYTSDDLFIDSDNPEIKNTAKSLVRNETNPVKAAEILYNYVIKDLRYDYFRAKDEEREFLYASEIMKRRKGVCVDYAILYTALLRAAGIPSRIVTGIPVYSILISKEKEIDMGHAWVEIKLPGYGWIPIDVTSEDRFMFRDYSLNIATEKGSSSMYKSKTMDWENYYYDGFFYSWDVDVETAPLTEQNITFSVRDLSIKDIELD